MLIWFVALSTVAVAEIFASPMVDYRVVAVGSILPLLDVLLGTATPLHTLLTPVALLAAVMVATTGRRLLRRRLLGLPVGLFLHLVLDGSWDNAELFWWPFLGTGLGDQPVPETSGVAVRLMLELVGVVIAVIAYRRYGLDQAENRQRLLRTGHLNRAYMRTN